ncbi:MAG: RHS repeat-associated core domain-containing protein, partial [candidate division KSB1 bacterium]|nr:RHS repeat-associated core domain-containing protein [candidate division KSB1 bacterium]
VATNSFNVALEQAEVITTSHGTETIGWLAITPGQGEWSGRSFQATRQARSVVTDSWYSISFGSTYASPRFVASLATYADSDNAHLRYRSLSTTGVQVRVEEDTTYDSETTHGAEAVHYLVFAGSGGLRARAWGSSDEVRRYYYFGGQRVAMRVSGAPASTPTRNGVYYIHTDHLGSTSLVTTGEDRGGLAAGSVWMRQLYEPYGAVRYASNPHGPAPTDYGYTGQRATGLGLLDYRARWYSPALGRFLSADTIVPSPGAPQAFNRYSYAGNSPLVFVDPSGHIAETEEKAANAIVQELLLYGVQIIVDWYHSKTEGWQGGLWQLQELIYIQETVHDFTRRLGGNTGDVGTDSAYFRAMMNDQTLRFVRLNETGNPLGNVGLEIRVRNNWLDPSLPENYCYLHRVGVAHEIAHAWDFVNGGVLSGELPGYRRREPGPTWYGCGEGFCNTSSPLPTADEWAESVTAWMYPGYITSLTDRTIRSPDFIRREILWSPAPYQRPGLGPLHQAYVVLRVGEVTP